MLATGFVLTSRSHELLGKWRAQLPEADVALADEPLRRELRQPGPRVWVCDLADERSQWICGADTVRIVVGQPQSGPFEQQRIGNRSGFCVSYAESEAQLGPVLMAASQLAAALAENHVLRERSSRPPFMTPEAPLSGRESEPEDCLLVETALPHLGNRAALFAELTRFARIHIGTLRAGFFVREGLRFTCAGQPDLTPCPAGGHLAHWIEENGAVINLDDPRRSADIDPGAEAEIRRMMATWRGRLLVPLLVEGGLFGWVVYGVCVDGTPHGPTSVRRALAINRSFVALLAEMRRIENLRSASERWSDLADSAANVRLIDASSPLDKLPVDVQAAVGEAMHRREVCVVEPTWRSPLRVVAGPVLGGPRVWVQWMDCSELVRRALESEHDKRIGLLAEIGLLLQHEVGNALVVPSAVKQMLDTGRPPPPDLVALMGREIERLNTLKAMFARLEDVNARRFVQFDTAVVAQALKTRLKLRVAAPDPTPIITGDPAAIIEALVLLVEACAQPRTADGDTKTTVEIARRGSGKSELAVIYIRHIVSHPLGIEGENSERHANLGVFVAREVITRHGGTLRAAQGLTDSELQISLGQADVPSTPPGEADSRPALFVPQ
jgi:hypothetical protein